MRRRTRQQTGRFVAEGEDLLAAADGAGWQPVERFCAAGSGLAGVEVDGAVLAKASGLASGTRALAVYEERWAEKPVGPLCVYLHGVQDPGNVGAILRSAQAFGASCVALGPASADPFGPKAVRASMGAIFSVPMARVGDAGRAARPQDRPGGRRRGAAGGTLADYLRGAEVNGRCSTPGEPPDRFGARWAPGGDRGESRSRRPYPDQHRLAQRRDGGDGRALRGN